jgi:tetratricopeptide (TPR) repeat protein
MKRLLLVVLLIQACIISAVCDAGPDLKPRPITNPTQRVEFDGFSILPPRAKGWIRLEQPPQSGPNWTVKSYFIKRLKEEVKSPSDLHRLTAVVRTFNAEGLKIENPIDFLKEIAGGFSRESFLDKCLGRDCVRYQSTEAQENPRFPGSVFLINKRGSVILHPDSPTLVINVEYRQYYARGAHPLSAEALETEVEPFQKSLEFTASYYMSGIRYAKQGQYDKAISNYTKAIEIDPRYEAYYDRGNVYLHKGQYDRAISDYTKAIELDPKLALAYYNRGLIYQNKGQLDRAISDYTKAIELNPKHTYAYNNRGNAYRKKGQYDRAISDYTKAIEIDPTHAKVYSNRAVSYYYKGEYDRAWKDVHKAQSLGYQVKPRFLKKLREASGRQE